MRVLGLDVGSSSVRALAYDGRGREIEGTLARRTYEPVYGSDGSAELDPGLLQGAAREVLDETARALGTAPDAVAASCFWHSLLLLDEQRRPLTPVLLWQDRRATPQADRLSARLDRSDVHTRTGSELHPSFWPAKLAWLRAERPALLARARHAVSFAEYLFLQLTGGLRRRRARRADDRHLVRLPRAAGERSPRAPARPLLLLPRRPPDRRGRCRLRRWKPPRLARANAPPRRATFGRRSSPRPYLPAVPRRRAQPRLESARRRRRLRP